MLDKKQLVELFETLGTPSSGQQLVMKARTHAPVRDVASRGGNVITLFASRKMGQEIRTESRHIEFAAAVCHEYDPSVLEFYAQPCKLNLELVDQATGEIRSIYHFPDFLVIREEGVTLEEWKSESKLTRLAERYPYRYAKGDDGLWYSPQIEQQLALKGIRYRICSDATLPRKRVENLLHLADYFHPGAEACPEHTLARVQEVLREHGAVYIDELLRPPFSFAADELFKAIADNLLVADLDREDLTQPTRARLYRDTTMRDFMASDVKNKPGPGQERYVIDIAPGATFRYEANTLKVSLVSEREVVCQLKDGSTRTLAKDWLLDALEEGKVSQEGPVQEVRQDLTRYSEEELRVALARTAMLRSEKPPVSERTLRRWEKRSASALALGANEVLALVPKTAARGNRDPRLSETQNEVIDNVIKTEWVSHEAMSYRACHNKLIVACEAAGVVAPSYPTFIEKIKQADSHQTQRARHGKRMAYQTGEFVDVLYADTPVHGSRPFQYVHIDHTQLDLEAISSRTGKPLGRPWLTIAIDAWPRRIVGLYLTFDPPSYTSVLMVIRDMVKRFQRLPEFFVVDNGSDFASKAFEDYLQAHGVHLRFRPSGRPRHGSVMERIFGSLNTEYVHNLAGNTKAMKHVRMTTGKHQPVNFAEWTLENIYHGICYWAFEYYDQERHPTLDCSPREAYMRGLREGGARPQRVVLFNQDFLIATCSPPDRGVTRMVNAQRGVKVNNMLYWHPVFRDSSVQGRRYQVRYDPWDAASIYVRVKTEWVLAQCKTLVGLGQLTDFERRALTEEYVRRGGKMEEAESTSRRLREFMQVFTPEGAMKAALERQVENKGLYRELGLGNVNPIVEPRRVGLFASPPSTPDLRTGSAIPDTPMNPSHGLPPADDQLPNFDTF